ncbi:MAG: Aldose 1-epimerase [uncultured Thiotrichaceae bacterium]|uniref:Putative glucose-6-phosphate 1-epimerase n=1 Tax=uncultured Thiotrichaceae bacterium TaxID=298394 RepID=A0A6S6S4R7_9GAMM|nr:MAG: Aldose 1-epimerase [uncultured Thiotrichaceae bacterium]
MNIDDLNARFAIDDELTFIEGDESQGYFPLIKVNNPQATALICLYGGQVMSFQPRGCQELLFVSNNAFYQSGKAIKGGIPVCWPWFGDDPEGLGRAAHGFVRNRLWFVEKTGTTDQGETQITLSLTDTEETRTIWPYAFRLQLLITIGKVLKLKLKTANTGRETFSLSQALHSYFAVSDIRKASVKGLEDVEYMDKTSASQTLVKQRGAVTVSEEVDRIYEDVPSALYLVDDASKRSIRIDALGSRSAVVWNPWVEGARAMADLQADDYQKFICVETTNAGTDMVEVMPDSSHTLGVMMTLGSAKK